MRGDPDGDPRAPAEGGRVVSPARSVMGLVLGIVNGVLIGLYPVAVWIGLSYLSTRAVGLIVFAFVIPILALRLRSADRSTFWAILRIPLAILGLVSLGVWLDDARYVLAMPVLINLVLLVTFGASLTAGSVPMIERFARMQDPVLSPEKQAHCRQFTGIWAGFFVLNGGIAGLLAVAATVSVWATYTGLLAYALMGSLFAFEYIVRKARFREYGRGPHDRWLAKLFPPDPRP